MTVWSVLKVAACLWLLRLAARLTGWLLAEITEATLHTLPAILNPARTDTTTPTPMCDLDNPL